MFVGNQSSWIAQKHTRWSFFEGTRYSLVYFTVPGHEATKAELKKDPLVAECGIRVTPKEEASSIWTKLASSGRYKANKWEDLDLVRNEAAWIRSRQTDSPSSCKGFLPM